MNKIHLHWRFRAWNGTKDDREVFHMLQVAVIGYNDEESALAAAKKIVTRDVYTLDSVYECNSCDFKQEVIDNAKKLTRVLERD